MLKTITIGLIAGSLAIIAAHLTHQDYPRPPIARTRTITVPEPSSPSFFPPPTTEPTLTDPYLDKIVPSVNADKQPLDDFLHDLSQATGETIVYNWVALGKTDPVTLHVANLSGHDILKRALKQASADSAPLSYQIENGVVRVTTVESLSHTLVLRTHDVHDFLNDNEKARRRYRRHTSTSQPDPPTLADQLLPQNAPPSIIILTTAMQTAAGRDATKGAYDPKLIAAIRYWNGRLFIYDTIENQQIFNDLLTQRRRALHN